MLRWTLRQLLERDGIPMKIGLNGFGKIGQALLQRLASTDEIEIVVINEIGMAVEQAGAAFASNCDVSGTGKLIHGRSTIEWLSQRDHRRIGWGNYGVDVVVEASRLFHRKEMEEQSDDAKITILMTGDLRNSTPDLTLVLGVNSSQYETNMSVLCAGSDRTQALVPILKTIDDQFGVNSYRVCMHRPPYVGTYGRVQDRPDNAAQLARALPALAGRGTFTRVEDPRSDCVTIWLDISTNKFADKRRICDALKQTSNLLPTAVACSEDAPSPVGDSHSALVDLSSLTAAEVADECNIWVKLVYDPITSYAERIREQLLFLSKQRGSNRP